MMKIQELFEEKIQNPEKFIGLHDDMLCSDSNIDSFEGFEHLQIRKVLADDNPNLKSLRGLPKKVGGWVSATKCGIESLQGIGKDYLCEMNGDLNLSYNPIKSHMLGLLKVKGLTKIHLNNCVYLEEIMNKYIPLGDIVACSEELIENGFKDYAKL